MVDESKVCLMNRCNQTMISVAYDDAMYHTKIPIHFIAPQFPFFYIVGALNLISLSFSIWRHQTRDVIKTYFSTIEMTVYFLQPACIASYSSSFLS